MSLAEDQDVSCLLTPQGEPLLPHALCHVAVTYRGSLQPDTCLSQTDLQPQVAHHGGDHRIPGQRLGGLHLPGQDGQGTIAIHEAPPLIHEDHAVTIAVEGDAQVGSLLDHCLGQGVRSKVLVGGVDVEPIGCIVAHQALRTQRLEKLRGQDRGGTVGTVEEDAHALQ